jgi:hypothetical protein
MADTAAHLSRIGDELQEDLAKVEADLAEARADVIQTESAHLAAVAESNELFLLAARGGDTRLDVVTTPELAAPLHSRLTAVRDDLIKPAARARARARAKVSALEYQRGTLRDSIRQIETALSGGRPAKVRRLEPAPKRVAPIVDFNNVSPATSKIG